VALGRAARRTLGRVLNKFARFSPEFLAEGWGVHDQAERDWFEKTRRLGFDDLIPRLKLGSFQGSAS
jgi:hypothetical protein